MRKLTLTALLLSLLALTAGAQAVFAQSGDQATVSYLGNAGWVVRLGDALLVFDYQEVLGTEDATHHTLRARVR